MINGILDPGCEKKINLGWKLHHVLCHHLLYILTARLLRTAFASQNKSSLATNKSSLTTNFPQHSLRNIAELLNIWMKVVDQTLL